MKRCPQCRRDYYDETLLYCLDDGERLLEGPALADEPATAILHDTAGLGEAATRAQIYTTEKTAVLPSGSVDIPTVKGFDKRLLFAPLALAVIVIGGLAGYRYLGPSTSGTIDSIAVLPFENRSGQADAEYLSDGLSDSLIYRLAQLPNLKVSPTSSVIRYKGNQADIAAIAKDLDVDAVMSGKLAQHGEDLTISVELTDARTKKLIWAEQYDRKMADLLATQREIATKITEKLQLKLAGDERGITKKYTDSNEAYQHYLQGRFYWNKRTLDSMPKAIEQFELAISKDPNFALAYAGLADAQFITHYLSRKWSDEYLIAQAQENANRAARLDPTLAEPHATLAIANQYQWKWDEAEREFKRAIELNPNYGTAYHWYSRFLRVEGRYDEALAQIRKGQEVDPLSLPIAENVVQNLLESGDTDAALAQCKRAIDLDPNFWAVHFRLAAVYFAKGQKDEGLAAAARSVELVNRAQIAMGYWGYALAVAGKRDEALAVVKQLENKYANKEMDGVRIASVYIGLGDKDKAFEWLEKDFQARRPTLMEICLEPEFKSLRDDPRYKDLMKRMGLLAGK